MINPITGKMEDKPAKIEKMVRKIPVFDSSNGPNQVAWSPYADNSGSVVAIGGPGYCVTASDTRLTSGYDIMTRNASKLFKLTDKVVVGLTSCWCDVLSFHRMIQVQQKMYEYDHGKQMDIKATARYISNMLYSRRFFPYYVTTILAGLDADGNGATYHYDPVGSMEKLQYTAGGASSDLLQPVLDHQIGQLNVDPSKRRNRPLTLDEAVKLIKDVFISAAERDINCGDSVDIKIIQADGIREEVFQLRKD